MSSVAMPLLQFFIPGIAATSLDIAQLAANYGTLPSSRLTYRFTYRISRGGPAYGCRIKTSRPIAEVLAAQLYTLADKAEADGDAALLAGCALALKAIQHETTR